MRWAFSHRFMAGSSGPCVSAIGYWWPFGSGCKKRPLVLLAPKNSSFASFWPSFTSLRSSTSNRTAPVSATLSTTRYLHTYRFQFNWIYWLIAWLLGGTGLFLWKHDFNDSLVVESIGRSAEPILAIFGADRPVFIVRCQYHPPGRLLQTPPSQFIVAQCGNLHQKRSGLSERRPASNHRRRTFAAN